MPLEPQEDGLNVCRKIATTKSCAFRSPADDSDLLHMVVAKKANCDIREQGQIEHKSFWSSSTTAQPKNPKYLCYEVILERKASRDTQLMKEW